MKEKKLDLERNDHVVLSIISQRFQLVMIEIQCLVMLIQQM